MNRKNILKNNYFRRSLIIRFILLLLLPLTAILQYIGSRNGALVEHVYSRGIYPVISGFISGYFHIFPFSAAEIFVYTAVIFIVFLFIQAVVYLCHRKIEPLLSLLLTAACFFTTGYFVFSAIWGLNYCRLPLGENLGYKTGTPTVSELCAIMQEETDKINSLCGSVSYDKNLRSYYEGGFNKMKTQVNAGYKALASQGKLQNQLFGKNTPYPKGILASNLWPTQALKGCFSLSPASQT